MTDAPLTRQDVEREVRESLGVLTPEPHYINDEDCWYSCPKARVDYRDGSACCDESQDANVCRCGADAANAGREADARRISAALLAMAECETCKGTGWLPVNSWRKAPERCFGFCSGTGLNQAVLARGLAALKGEGA